MPRSGRVRAVIAGIRFPALPAAAIALALVLTPARAVAHEGGEQIPARTLVEQAIAIIVTQPGQMGAIEDKIHDALDAADAEGVALAEVMQAETAFEAGDLAATQQHLERSIGARPGQPVISPNPGPRLPISTLPVSGPTDVLRAIPGRPTVGAARAFLLALAGVVALGGIAIVRRYR